MSVLLANAAEWDGACVSHFLHPGRLFAARRAYRVTTILGSCVAVCLYDPDRRVGGVNHFILPLSDARVRFDQLRFGNHAVPALIRAVQRQGADRRALIAKVFGGAALFEKMSHHAIGRDNIEAAYRELERHGIPVVAEDVGGKVGRKLIFDTGVGSALVKRL